jgi:hypothetical protein
MISYFFQIQFESLNNRTLGLTWITPRPVRYGICQNFDMAPIIWRISQWADAVYGTHFFFCILFSTDMKSLGTDDIREIP